MSRPHTRRRWGWYRGARVYKPSSIPMSGFGRVHLALGELEAMRLCDLEGLDHAAVGARMAVSRGTIHRLLERAGPRWSAH